MRLLPQRRRLPNGRLYLHDGPIDLIIQAYGEDVAIETAYAAAWRRFTTVLDELCAELPLLRMQARRDSAQPEGVVARRMADAVLPLCDCFITPMAAVAGAVAEEVLNAMTTAAPLSRAYVNNGGDIALHLLSDEHFTVGMVDRPNRPSLIGNAVIRGRDLVRGVATSGWRGRSFSLGIADAVTVFAASAAVADATATLIANAVDLSGHPAVRRAPANACDPQSDLGERLVTVDVGPLAPFEIDEALAAGLAEAEKLRKASLLEAAALQLNGRTLLCGAKTARMTGHLPAQTQAELPRQLEYSAV